MTAGNQSPVPQFGSQKPSFDIICLWERPGAEVIGSRLHDLKLSASNVIVLYLGRLTNHRRNNLMHFNRDNSLSLALLDELLLLFLARETESRLRTLLRCALPLANVNPYTETGSVPPEMFFGRIEERKSLQEPMGYALVYGGRQLGKSALLQQVEREFHSPPNDRYVLREDIKFIGDALSAQNDPELIWQHLRDGLVALDLLKGTVGTRPEMILAKIRAMMLENPNRHLLVLFDEADNFLAADIKRNFEIVSKLKSLMDDTQRRFKVIFAGLHNVQRYEGIPNQPFAHLRPLQVGPLEPKHAHQLIQQPLEALGFRFPEGDDTPILGILAYTNYHPGLIQLFCQKLLHMMYQRRPRDLGPYEITRDDIEAVYRQREVQQDIRRRFEWTLALDQRYKALAQIMVLDQIQDRDGFTKAYSLDSMLDLSRGFWSEAFQATTRDEFRGYLDEMAGLGVLVRTKDDEYRLRSPNLVRLMGTAEDIWGSLGELTSKSLDPTLQEDSHHAPLDETARRYSPFTYKQSRVLNAKRFGVGMIFGSAALGIDLAGEAFKAHFIAPTSSGFAHEINVASTTGEALSKWLINFWNRHREKERVIVYHNMQGPAEVLATQVEAALSFCQSHRKNKRQWMRILLIFDSVAAREWLRLPAERRKPLEEYADATVGLRRWDETGVLQRLKQHDKIGSEQIIQRILHDLGGWPLLLDLLAKKWGKSNDPSSACAELRQLLDNSNSEVAQQLLAANGWAIDKDVQQVIRILAAEEAVPRDMLVPAILGDHLTAEECEAIVAYLHRMDLILQKDSDVVVEPVIKRIVLAS